MKQSFFHFLCFLITGYQVCYAQESLESSEKIQIKANEITYEKVYLHLDRSIYVCGEDIWFKAYLVDANNNHLINSSNNLHVELISPGSEIIERETIQLVDGTGHGDFKVAENLPGGIYIIRAYTNWMRNFKEQGFFTRQIELHNIHKDIVQERLQDESGKPLYDLQFFPEGGSLVENVSSVVGFKATGKDGLGCRVIGSVTDGSNDTLVVFEGTHLGMGSFPFKPEAGTHYFATGIVNGNIPFRISLPEPLRTGYVLKISDIDSSDFEVHVLTNQATLLLPQTDEVFLRATTRKMLCTAGHLKIYTTDNAFRLPKKKFPEGITRLTIFDSQYHPQCERLFYVHTDNSVSLTFETDKKEYAPGESVILTISAKDKQQNPVITNLSVAITDLNLTGTGHPSGNIVSNLLLESEIRGNIEQPYWYFDSLTTERNQALDNLLLTQGWRDFIWKQLEDSAFTVQYPMEKRISISGYLRQVFKDKPIAHANVSLFLEDTLSDPIIRITETNEQGRFYVNDIQFNGTCRLFANAYDDKGNPRGSLSIDSLFYNPPAAENFPLIFNKSNNDETTNNNPAGIQEKEKDKLVETYLNTQTENANIITIEEVTVKAQKKNYPAMINDDITRIYGEPDKVIALKDYPACNDLYNLFNLANIPGVRVTMEEGVIVFHSTHGSISFLSEEQKKSNGIRSQGYFIAYLNGNPFPIDMLTTIPITLVEKIEIKTNQVGLAIYGSRPVLGVVSIITKKNFIEKYRVPQSTGRKDIEGYYESRVFYNPVLYAKNQADTRTSTILWAPDVLTDAWGKATLTFYNTNRKAVVKIEAEGIALPGTATRGEASYTVK